MYYVSTITIQINNKIVRSKSKKKKFFLSIGGTQISQNRLHQSSPPHIFVQEIEREGNNSKFLSSFERIGLPRRRTSGSGCPNRTDLNNSSCGQQQRGDLGEVQQRLEVLPTPALATPVDGDSSSGCSLGAFCSIHNGIVRLFSFSPPHLDN